MMAARNGSPPETRLLIAPSEPVLSPASEARHLILIESFGDPGSCQIFPERSMTWRPHLALNGALKLKGNFPVARTPALLYAIIYHLALAVVGNWCASDAWDKPDRSAPKLEPRLFLRGEKVFSKIAVRNVNIRINALGTSYIYPYSCHYLL